MGVASPPVCTEDQRLTATIKPGARHYEHRCATHESTITSLIDSDSSWMRDNGPRYVEVDGNMVLQNWAFTSYEANTPVSYYRQDNALPDDMAALLNLPLEQVGLIHERGDLEVNGTDTAMVSWSVLSHRNPGMSQPDVTAAIQEPLGHTDGLARFISEDTEDDPYLNWLVGDSFVLTGKGVNDADARQQMESYFPGREIHFVDVHCVTNDQPQG